MNTPVINVNGQPVTRFELTNAMQEYALQMHEKTVDELDDAEHDEILHTSVEKLVVWELIYQQSVADGVAVDAQDVEKEIDGIASQFSSRDEMYAKLAEVEVGPELLERSVRREILVEGVLDRWFSEVPEPTDAEIDAGYREYLEGHDDDMALADDRVTRGQAEPMIRTHLKQKAGTERIRAWVEELRDRAEIEFLADL